LQKTLFPESKPSSVLSRCLSGAAGPQALCHSLSTPLTFSRCMGPSQPFRGVSGRSITQETCQDAVQELPLAGPPMFLWVVFHQAVVWCRLEQTRLVLKTPCCQWTRIWVRYQGKVLQTPRKLSVCCPCSLPWVVSPILFPFYGTRG